VVIPVVFSHNEGSGEEKMNLEERKVQEYKVENPRSRPPFLVFLGDLQSQNCLLMALKTIAPEAGVVLLFGWVVNRLGLCVPSRNVDGFHLGVSKSCCIQKSDTQMREDL
jgi:hypothetical protein